MPRDILHLNALRIVERDNEDYLPLEEASKNETPQHRTENQINNHEYFRDIACYNNYGISESNGKSSDSYYNYKTSSLPGPVTISNAWDDEACSVLDVSPEDIASQLTLLDDQCFKAITSDELVTCGWNKANKQTVAPNVVAFTKRFNRIIFWVVQEILNEETPKARAEIMSHFIKIGKKLHDLNSIHSLFAIITALRSASIFRLKQTWACLSKKDKQLYDKMADIFCENANWSALRSHLNNVSLPCIPYLGLFLTDLIYIDLVHPVGTPHRAAKIEVVLRALQRYQTSVYNIPPLPRVTTYLSSIRYIEELQIFVEKDQFKLSQKLEGPSPAPSGFNSNESIKGSSSSAALSLSPSHRSTSSSFRSNSNVHPIKFHPTHRKCRSLGSNIFCYNKNQSEDKSDRSTPVMSLLDDTVLESPGTSGRMSLTLNSDSKLENPFISHQGCIKRKTIYKNGKKISLSPWQRYWCQIHNSSLLYFLPKTFKSFSRGEYRREPCKMVHLQDWSVGIAEGDAKDSFNLVNHQTRTLYKFKTTNEETARHWIEKIKNVTNNTVKPLPDNLLHFE